MLKLSQCLALPVFVSNLWCLFIFQRKDKGLEDQRWVKNVQSEQSKDGIISYRPSSKIKEFNLTSEGLLGDALPV